MSAVEPRPLRGHRTRKRKKKASQIQISFVTSPSHRSAIRLSYVKLLKLFFGKCYALPAKEGFPEKHRKASRFNTNSSSLPLAGYAFSRLTPLRGYSFTRRLRPRHTPKIKRLILLFGRRQSRHRETLRYLFPQINDSITAGWKRKGPAA